MTRAEEIASMVLFLISSQASHITGQHLSSTAATSTSIAPTLLRRKK